MSGEFSLLLGISLVLSLGAVVQMVRAALPDFMAVRDQLAATPATRELRFTITQTVVSWDDGTVVALPVRLARLARPAFAERTAPLSAAA